MVASTRISHLDDGKVEILTPRLVLRAATEDDARTLHEAFSDAEVMRYCSRTHTSEKETLTWLLKRIPEAQNGTTDFVITLPSVGAVGKIGVWQNQEIGFLLSRKYWDKGLAREALVAVLGYLFSEKNMDEVTADMDPRNQRSMSLVTNLGFVKKPGFREKIWDSDDGWLDSVSFGLQKTAWSARTDEDC